MHNREVLETILVKEILIELQRDIEAKGEASLLVSGGSTPIGLFHKLSEAQINWSKVKVSLVDERFLPDGHPDQNGTMVKRKLLQNEAANATFIPLIQDADSEIQNLGLAADAVKTISRPFTVVILGMGSDGHTASLFPASPQLAEAMNLKGKSDLMITDPITAPYRRITFTRKALLQTKRLFLHAYGDDKQQILTSALLQTDYHPYPIGGFNNQDEVKLEVYWSK
jgi:6-phosphogluconolactonase